MVMELAIITGTVVLMTAIHEVAHLVAAMKCRVRVTRLCVGLGPKVMTLRICGIPFEFRILPGFGLCDVKELDRLAPSRRLFIAIAGPLANLSTGLLLSVAGAASGSEIVALAGAAGVGMGLINLLPLAPLDGWVVFVNGLRCMGFSVDPAGVARMTRASSSVLVVLAGLWGVSWLPGGSETFIAVAVVAVCTWIAVERLVGRRRV